MKTLRGNRPSGVVFTLKASTAAGLGSNVALKRTCFLLYEARRHRLLFTSNK